MLVRTNVRPKILGGFVELRQGCLFYCEVLKSSYETPSRRVGVSAEVKIEIYKIVWAPQLFQISFRDF